MGKDNCWKKVCRVCRENYPDHKTDCEFNPKNERVIGFHDKCGGNIIKKDQCRWCEKYKDHFCGCATL